MGCVSNWMVVLLIIVGSERARAEYVSLIPPNDPSGKWFTNSHDNGPLSRGIVFQMSSDATIDAVSTVLDGSLGSLQIAEVTSLAPDVTAGATLLRSSTTRLISNDSPKWISYAISPLTLQKGRAYHIEITQIPDAQTFLYRNDNVPFTVGAFASIDGTLQGNTWNSGLPAIQLHLVDTVATPEPDSWLCLGIGIFGIFGYRRARKNCMQTLVRQLPM